MGNIKEPGPPLYTATDPAIKYLREAAHTYANRSLETRRRLIKVIENIEAEAAISPVTGFEDASENLDKYLY
jgi:citrate synthase